MDTVAVFFGWKLVPPTMIQPLLLNIMSTMPVMYLEQHARVVRGDKGTENTEHCDNTTLF
jgi:hypothetical protein